MMDDVSFVRPPAWIDSAFEAGQVHVWRIDLDRFSRNAWRAALRAEDFQRAGRFVRQEHRDRFLQGRYCLLSLLSAYAGCTVRELGLQTGKHGKPCLPREYRLGFNLSHSENLAVIAVGRAPSIGIDIERLVSPRDIRALARQVFSERENAAFDALTDAQCLLPFFVCWTRKEAFLKSLGIGLTVDPRDIHVGLTAEPSRITHGLGQSKVHVATIDIGQVVVSLAVGDGAYRGSFKICDYPIPFASEAQS